MTPTEWPRLKIAKEILKLSSEINEVPAWQVIQILAKEVIKLNEDVEIWKSRAEINGKKGFEYQHELERLK